MGRVQAVGATRLDAAAARELWLDPARWPTFVDGFAHVVRTKGHWPAEGAALTWTSRPHGRGTVLERVVAASADEVVTQVVEERLQGTQTVRFAPGPDGTQVAATLDYELARANVVTDVLFVRRALRDALRRTVTRFVREADAEVELRAG